MEDGWKCETFSPLKVKYYVKDDIEKVDLADYGMECEILEYEYVEFGDGEKLRRFPVYSKEDKEFNGDEEAYWRVD